MFVPAVISALMLVPLVLWTEKDGRTSIDVPRTGAVAPALPYALWEDEGLIESATA